MFSSQEPRLQTLREIIKSLHSGEDPEQAKQKLRTLVRQASASEIAAMEQELIAEGMRVEEIMSMCDLHSQVAREILEESQLDSMPPGHPVDTFHRENMALASAVERTRTIACGAERVSEDAEAVELAYRLREAVNELLDVDKHYQRKEYLLFSKLEQYGITGPSQVMWGKDDEVRGLLRAAAELLAREDLTTEQLKNLVQNALEPALRAVEEMIQKEERILLPMSLQKLSDADWAEIWLHSPEFGFAIVEPREGYLPPGMDETGKQVMTSKENIILPTGTLNLSQLEAILNTLPVELTFVDADDRVRYFTQGKDKIFQRSRAVLGRKVQNCHPPKSVHLVNKILDDFRNNRANVAEFWINLQGRTVHIRYFAVRGGNGEYLGTLEVTQDITAIKALQGERRLPQYDK